MEWIIAGLSVEALPPSRGMRAMVDLARNFPDIASLLWPNRLSWAAWQELRNKLEAFLAFATADRWMRGAADENAELTSAVQAVADRGDFLALWTTEGLGYYYTTHALRQNAAVQGLMQRYAERLPARSLIPLHTGMGLAFAEDRLRCLPRTSHRDKDRGCVERYLWRCQANALPGYEVAASEALGLITRLLRPALLPEMDRQLHDIDASLVGSLWHGVGRGLYFTPTNLLPCTAAAWPSLTRALEEPPHDPGRDNALAGLAWALALVNVRNPEVIELFLRRHEQDLPMSGALSNGISSAAAVWHMWSPDTNYLQQLCSYQPCAAEGATRDNWERHARRQCSPEFYSTVERLKQQNRLDELFQVRRPDPDPVR